MSAINYIKATLDSCQNCWLGLSGTLHRNRWPAGCALSPGNLNSTLTFFQSCRIAAADGGPGLWASTGLEAVTKQKLLLWQNKVMNLKQKKMYKFALALSWNLMCSSKKVRVNHERDRCDHSQKLQFFLKYFCLKLFGKQCFSGYLS